ncbi:hypothetical protein [Novosphingobium terrae]|uniref:hypothetical protein n=1 Tax=Novosphingobium terrae TaxID=2726189 RepID=UPI001981F116|nr:hypothetical protein [Novosphingobium terrae]
MPFPALSRRCWAVFAWLLLVALVTRASVLGDVSYFNDESFYRLAGLRLHEGLLPYADVWDRKGPGLFLLWWLITFLPGGVLAYQLLACLVTALTAAVATTITRRFAGEQGAVLAGTAYLVSLPLFGGAGGQSPVFYNLLTALAAWLLLRAGPAMAQGRMPRGVIGAMLLAGLAISFKQTAAFEGAFFGLWALAAMARGGASLARLAGRAALMVAAGLAPLALAGAFFVARGHGAEFWHAMVTANLAKHYDLFDDYWHRFWVLVLAAAPLLIAALCGLLWRDKAQSAGRSFMALWLVAALAGVLVLPNLYEHYLLPLMLPLSITAGFALNRGAAGRIGVVAVLGFYVATSTIPDFATRHAASARVKALAEAIDARQAHPRLLVYEGPMSLYALVRGPDAVPPSPLLDNFHLYFPGEDNTSHLDTAAEMRRILDWHPSVVVAGTAMGARNENQRTRPLVDAYLAQHCRPWRRLDYTEMNGTMKAMAYLCEG